MRKFNIALTLDEDVTNDIIIYAKELYSAIDSDVILGTNSNPHITIGQFTANEDIAREIWKNFRMKISILPKINLAGIAILPTEEGDLWIEISVLKSQELLNLQKELITIVSPFGELANDIGDNYRPHITIAHTNNGFDFPKFRLNFKTLRSRSIKTQLGIGLGTNFENLVM